MDLTKYYELKHQPHNLRLVTDSLGGAGPTGVGGAELDDRLALPPSSCSSSSVAAVSRARSPLRSSSRLSAASGGEAVAVMLPHHFLDGAPPKTAVISGADGRLSDHHLEELYKERSADSCSFISYVDVQSEISANVQWFEFPSLKHVSVKY